MGCKHCTRTRGLSSMLAAVAVWRRVQLRAKQGRLSPKLSGLLRDGLHWALAEEAPGAAPQLRFGCLVPALGYANVTAC